MSSRKQVSPFAAEAERVFEGEMWRSVVAEANKSLMRDLMDVSSPEEAYHVAMQAQGLLKINAAFGKLARAEKVVEFNEEQRKKVI